MQEEWNKIKEYPNYSISSTGMVRNDKTGVARKLSISKSGYRRVGLHPSKYPDHRQPDYVLVARLVAKAFISNDRNLPEVNHIDGDKENNNVSNLEWCSSSQNQIHAYRSGLQVHAVGEKWTQSKLKEKDIVEIRTMWKSGKYKQKEIAIKFGVIQQNISHIVRGNTWSHVGSKKEVIY